MAEAENRVVRDIVIYLKLSGYTFWRSNNFTAHGHGGYRTPPPGWRPGIPDLIAFNYKKCGQMIFIEVKAPKGKTSPEQEAFLAEARHQGHLAFVARSLADVQKELAKGAK